MYFSPKIHVPQWFDFNSRCAQITYAGGDKPSSRCKAMDSEEIDTYKQAMQDLVKAVAIAHAQGKTLDDYWAFIADLKHFGEVSLYSP